MILFCKQYITLYWIFASTCYYVIPSLLDTCAVLSLFPQTHFIKRYEKKQWMVSYYSLKTLTRWKSLLTIIRTSSHGVTPVASLWLVSPGAATITLFFLKKWRPFLLITVTFIDLTRVSPPGGCHPRPFFTCSISFVHCFLSWSTILFTSLPIML